jgi:GTP-binding protein
VRAPNPLASKPVDFIGSFPDPLQPLDPPLPEFAFIGRSNVGKSSLLNALTGRRQLARVSSTPGKTQLLNVFRVEGIYLLDLPGYGYARVTKSERAAYRKMLERLLQQRSSLTGVVWLLDSRHAPSKDDVTFHSLLVRSGNPTLTVLTKVDKLTQRQREAAVRDRAAELGVEVDQLQPVSAERGDGIAELAESILAAAVPES